MKLFVPTKTEIMVWCVSWYLVPMFISFTVFCMLYGESVVKPLFLCPGISPGGKISLWSSAIFALWKSEESSWSFEISSASYLGMKVGMCTGLVWSAIDLLTLHVRQYPLTSFVCCTCLTVPHDCAVWLYIYAFRGWQYVFFTYFVCLWSVLKHKIQRICCLQVVWYATVAYW